MATSVSFGFASASTYGKRFDLNARMDGLAANGYMILTNGMDPNQKVEPEFGMTDLIPRAPRDEIYPAITSAPSGIGKIFGNSFKWRIRYRNSRTGETTGLSPLPFVGVNLGVTVYQSATVATFMGQTAYFSFSGFAFAAAGDDRAGMDTFDLFRNTSDQTDVFYKVASKANPGAGVLVFFTDNTPDEELWHNEQSSLLINPTYYTPLPPPCVHSFQHGTGRVFLYGRYNMGPLRSGINTGAITADDTLFGGSSAFLFRGREGQLFNFVTDATKTNYRIIEVTDPNAMYVTPKAPVAMNATWEIIDDVDSRTIFMLEPNQPWSWDPSNSFLVGLDLADGVMGMFAIGEQTFVLTRHHLWALTDDLTEDPKTTLRINKVADVGACGLWAWCEAGQYGVVFVDENEGVMTFSGNGLPVPLGNDDPLSDFKPKTQFQNFDRGMISETYCEWDPDAKRVIVSYCPVGVGAMIEQLSYDPVAGNWRGPWRRPLYRGGKLRDSTGKDVFFLGDLTGTLMYEGDITTDLVASQSGVVTTLDNPVLITALLGTFSPTQVGAPILFSDGAGNYYLNWIIRSLSSSQIQLLFVPEVTILAAWTYQVGYIHWQAKTAFIDLNEPGQPKALRKLEVGYNRVSSGVDNFVVDCVTEGCTITESADGTAVTGGLIKASVDTNNGGTAFTLRFSGRTQYGNVQITKMLAHVTACGGEEVPTAPYRTKVVITPTVTT